MYALKVEEQSRTVYYHYCSNTSNKVSGALGSFFSRGFYAVYSRPLLAVSFSASARPVYFAVPHSSVVADVGNSPEDVVKNSIENGATEKEVAALLINRPIYRRKEVSLAIFQIRKV